VRRSQCNIHKNVQDTDRFLYIIGESNRKYKNPHWAVFKAFWRIGIEVSWWQPASRAPSSKLQVLLNCHHQFSELVKFKCSFIYEVLTGSIRKWTFYEEMNLFTAVMFTWTENIFRFFHIVAKSGYRFQVVPPVCPSLCLSVLSACAAPMGRIFMKFDIGNFYENMSRTTSSVKIGQKYRAIYMDT